MTDGELAAAFAMTGSSDPFDELVRRHVHMVYRTCRRVTGDLHDAEDATQAVFSTLASRAASLASYHSLAGWLYSTAWNVARRARAARATRSRYEQRWAPARADRAHAALSDDELSELYRAMRMLPPDYLHAIVLHHLEGMTIAQVAELTGSSVGTTAARLSRARAMMRERLARRGISMPLAAFSAVMALETASEDVVPATLLAQLPHPAFGAAAHVAVVAGSGAGASTAAAAAGWATKWAVAACVAVSVGAGSLWALPAWRSGSIAANPTATRQRTVVGTSAADSKTVSGGRTSALDFDLGLSRMSSSSVVLPEPSVLWLFGPALLVARRPRRQRIGH